MPFCLFWGGGENDARKVGIDLEDDPVFISAHQTHLFAL